MAASGQFHRHIPRNFRPFAPKQQLKRRPGRRLGAGSGSISPGQFLSRHILPPSFSAPWIPSALLSQNPAKITNIHIIKKRDCQRQSLPIHSSKTDQSPSPLLMYPLALTVRSYPSYRQVSWLGTQTYYLPFPPRSSVHRFVLPYSRVSCRGLAPRSLSSAHGRTGMVIF